MKRAILATAGTLSGLVAVLSYSPAAQTAVLASDGAGAGAGLGGPSGSTSDGAGSGTLSAQGSGKAVTRPVQGASRAPVARPTKPKAGAAARPSHSAKPSAVATPTASASTSAAPAANPTTSAQVVVPKVTVPVVQAQPKTSSAAPKPPKSTPPPAPVGPKDYQGAAVTYKYGVLQMAIRVQGGKIIDAWAVTYPKGDSLPYSEMAIPILRSQTISANSAHIAGATGASLTTAAWISSLSAAISQAHL